MSLLGLTQRVVVDPGHRERRDALDQRWPLFLAELGMVGIALPNNPETAVRLAQCTGIVGIVLTGGDDLVEYGGEAPERDATERSLLNLARSETIPVLGVCRGMQAIQHAFGVKLQRASGHISTRHDIIVDRATRSVNSYHNLIARISVQELIPWATTADGAIEAIRHETEPIAGIMWHPERNIPFDPLDLDFFRSFFGVRK